MPFIDALKAICCLLIVTHHLAIYDPMSDIAYPLIPALMEWLREYGRIAVQMFFVIAGFLTAAKLAPQGLSLVTAPIKLIRQRYLISWLGMQVSDFQLILFTSFLVHYKLNLTQVGHPRPALRTMHLCRLHGFIAHLTGLFNGKLFTGSIAFNRFCTRISQ